MLPLLSLLLSRTWHWQASTQDFKSSAIRAWLPRARQRPKFRYAMCAPKIDQRVSTNVRSWKKFVRENLKRIIFECSNIRCSTTIICAQLSTCCWSLLMSIASLLSTKFFFFFLGPKAYLQHPQNGTKLSHIPQKWNSDFQTPAGPTDIAFLQMTDRAKKGQVNNV